MERLSGSGSLPDHDSDQGVEGVSPCCCFFPLYVNVSFILSFFNHVITSLSVSIFSPTTLCCVYPLCFRSEPTGVYPVLIRPGKGSGDNTSRCGHSPPCPAFPRELGVSQRSR